MEESSIGRGCFVISLDFELMWGVLDQPFKNDYIKNIIKGRETIPHILKLFDKYQIHATWATVGLLFLDDKKEIEQYSPSLKPTYKINKCSSYTYIDEIKDGIDDNLYFARTVIDLIRNTKGQEVGSHTFSHYYCNEEGADCKSFYQDLVYARKVARDTLNIELNSLVFPRNQAKADFVEAAEKAGFKTWRGNAKGYSVVHNPILKRINRIERFVDTYIPIFGSLCYDRPKYDGKIVCEKSSRFFRPYSERLRFLEWLKISRIKKQMEYAAKNGKVFHLWWHPHNFGGHPKHMLCQLEEILQYYKELNNKYGYTSCSMSELIEL